MLQLQLRHFYTQQRVRYLCRSERTVWWVWKKGRLRIKIFPHCAGGWELLSQQAVGAAEKRARVAVVFTACCLSRVRAANELFEFSHFNFFCIFNPKVSARSWSDVKYFVLTLRDVILLFTCKKLAKAKFACWDKHKKHMKVKEMDVMNSANCMKVSRCVCVLYSGTFFFSRSAAVNEATVALSLCKEWINDPFSIVLRLLEMDGKSRYRPFSFRRGFAENEITPAIHLWATTNNTFAWFWLKTRRRKIIIWGCGWAALPEQTIKDQSSIRGPGWLAFPMFTSQKQSRIVNRIQTHSDAHANTHTESALAGSLFLFYCLACAAYF